MRHREMSKPLSLVLVIGSTQCVCPYSRGWEEWNADCQPPLHCLFCSSGKATSSLTSLTSLTSHMKVTVNPIIHSVAVVRVCVCV